MKPYWRFSIWGDLRASSDDGLARGSSAAWPAALHPTSDTTRGIPRAWRRTRIATGPARSGIHAAYEAPRRHTMPSAQAAGKRGSGAGRTSVSQSWKVTGHFFRLYLRSQRDGDSGYNAHAVAGIDRRCRPGRRPFTCTVYPACACSWLGSRRVPPHPSPLRSRRRPSQNAGRACSPAPNWVSTFPNSTTSTTGGSSSPGNASIRSARCLMRARGITWATMPPPCARSAARSRSMSTRSTTPGPFEPSWNYRKGPTSLRWTK